MGETLTPRGCTMTYWATTTSWSGPWPTSLRLSQSTSSSSSPSSLPWWVWRKILEKKVPLKEIKWIFLDRHYCFCVIHCIQCEVRLVVVAESPISLLIGQQWVSAELTMMSFVISQSLSYLSKSHSAQLRENLIWLHQLFCSEQQLKYLILYL